MGTKQLFILSVCLGSATLAMAQQELTKGTGTKETVFVSNLMVAPSVVELANAKQKSMELKRFAEVLDTQFVTSLNATRQFQLVDRKRLSEIREEQKLTELQQIDVNDKNAAKALSMAGAKYAFQPTLNAYEDRTQSSTHNKIGRSSMARKIFVSGVVQVVDTTKGTLLPDSPSVEIEKVEKIELAMPGAPMESDQVVVMLAKEMANQLCQKVINLLRPAKVLAVTGKQIMINRGTDAGFNKGLKVEVYATQDTTDADTGEVFRNEVPMGQATVVRTDPKQSFAMIEGEDNGIAKGCIVKVLEAAATPVQEEAPSPSEKPIKFD